MTPAVLFLVMAFLSAACVGSIRAPVTRSTTPAGKVPDYDDGTWSLTLENDNVSGQDGNYTSGTAVAWTSGRVESYPEESFTNRLIRLGRFLPQVESPDPFGRMARRMVWGA